MPLAHRLYDSALVLAPSGRLDHDNCEAFREELAPFLERSAKERLAIVLDLAGLEYVSSAGLRCFMLAAKQAKAQNSRIVIAAMQPVVSEIFQIARFNLVFDAFPKVRDALAALSPAAAAAFDRG
ncbi:MAG: STAS domain-containing protein [Betaproteobacteria bacterium]|nr:STAS domain-containing protein [Betaproteobacteria bacterium]MDH5221148.1 STAS domain-containing protein [Betaproteobacteria bacterium]MDH5350698.1 STAS domain-containing protein [Betaproteobacteria bacterium]